MWNHRPSFGWFVCLASIGMYSIAGLGCCECDTHELPMYSESNVSIVSQLEAKMNIHNLSREIYMSMYHNACVCMICLVLVACFFFYERDRSGNAWPIHACLLGSRYDNCCQSQCGCGAKALCLIAGGMGQVGSRAIALGLIGQHELHSGLICYSESNLFPCEVFIFRHVRFSKQAFAS